MHFRIRRLAFGMVVLGVAQLLMACSVLRTVDQSVADESQQNTDHEPTSAAMIESIAADYANSQSLTDQSRRVADYIYLLCRLPSDEEYLAAETLHGPFFVKVYVNESGADTIFTEADPTYPVGTIIVKEKSSGVEAEFADNLGIMIKREAGFNPDGGDWEYIYWEGGDIFQTPSNDLSHCQACHVDEAEEDSVFRLGSPQEARSFDSIDSAPPSESD